MVDCVCAQRENARNARSSMNPRAEIEVELIEAELFDELPLVPREPLRNAMELPVPF